MTHAFRLLGLLGLTLILAGCEGNPNKLSADADSPEYLKKSSDKMKEMYGPPVKAQAGSTFTPPPR